MAVPEERGDQVENPHRLSGNIRDGLEALP